MRIERGEAEFGVRRRQVEDERAATSQRGWFFCAQTTVEVNGEQRGDGGRQSLRIWADIATTSSDW